MAHVCKAVIEGSAEAQLAALGFITNIGNAETVENGLLAVPLVVELLIQGSSRQKYEAAAALRSLSATHIRVADAAVDSKGCLRAITDILNSTSTAKEHAAAALRSMSRTEHGRTCIGNSDALLPLVCDTSITQTVHRALDAGELAPERPDQRQRGCSKRSCQLGAAPTKQ